MSFKKFFSLVAAFLLICGANTSAFAEFLTVGVGVPIQHNFTSKWANGNKIESENVSGSNVYIKIPGLPGIGYESITTGIKSYDESLVKYIALSVNMFDIYYLTPLPVINFTIGLGAGTANLSCKLVSGESCGDLYESGSVGSAYQWYGQLGYSFLPFFDVHLTYQNLTAKVKEKDGGGTDTYNGSVIGAGVAFIF